MNRRKLLSWFGLGWLVSLLPSSLVGCSANSPSASSSPAATETVATTASNEFKVIGTVAQLNTEGALVSDKIAVVRDPKDTNKLLAVSTVCTHKQCDVKWKSAKYICPCHDAEFAADGTVLEGPAKKPLQRYAAKIENGQVLVGV